MGSYTQSLIGYTTTTIPFAVTGTVAGTSAVFGSVSMATLSGTVPAVSGANGSVGGAFPVTGQAPAVGSAFGSVVSSSSLYNPSAVGYATTTLNDPTVAYAVAGKAAGSSGVFGSAGNSVYHASQIGFATGALYPPGSGPTYGNSSIGYVTQSLSAPHRPVAVLTSTGLRHVAIRTWDGTKLR